jgi:translation initiation factor IF-3
MVNLAREHDWKFAICSFENQPEVHISRLMEINTEKRFFDGNNKMSEDDKNTAFKWVENHFLFLDSEGAEPSSIDSILERARVAELDVVEVAAQADPPVCRIMDYGKFRYEESQRLKESRKKTVQITMKEVKFRPKIGKGDFDTKVRHMHEFLGEGHKVKVTLQFRGREVAHPELGRKILDAVIEQLGPIARVDTMARLEGRNMTMVLSPEKKTTKKPTTQQPTQKAATQPAPEIVTPPVAQVSEAPVTE